MNSSISTASTSEGRTVLVIGGHGKVALLLAAEMADTDNRLISVIRHAEQSDDVRRAGAEPLVADVTTMSAAELDRLIEGVDAVVWSAGNGGRAGAEQTYAIDRDGCQAVVDAISRSSSRPRFILVSWSGLPDHGVDPAVPFFAYADAKAQADRYTMASSVDWTILGPTSLSLEAAGGITVLPDGHSAHPDTPTSRQAVARVIVAVLAHPQTTSHRFIRFSDGPTPIPEAFA
ncbi:MAG: NAD(P)H-binding protein [Acidipropionibacterium jensenii]|nr:NAD(P)H-binding protein [Acidipropionibacterium jensenii]